MSKIKTRRIGVDCFFVDRKFWAGYVDSVSILTRKLDEANIFDQYGLLIFEFATEESDVSVKFEATFRWSGGTRRFVTNGNYEAINMLMNKLIRKGILKQFGRLIFEFIGVADASMNKGDGYFCACGHHLYAHVDRSRSRGRCDVDGCKCKKYVRNSKQAPI